MTRLFVPGLALQVRTNSRDQPAVFELNGRRFVVERIVQQWEVDTDWWTEQGRAWRRHYAVIARDCNLFCILSYDVLAEVWQLDKVYD